LNALLRESGCAVLQERQIQSMIGNGLPRLIEQGFQAAGVELSESQLQSLIPQFMLIYSARAANETRLYPDTESVLKHFHRSGVRLGVCTNKPENISRRILSGFKVADYFQAVIGGDSTARTKPDPLPLQACLDELDALPHDSLMVGDSGIDVATARALHMPVGIVSFGYSRQSVSTLGADFLIDRLSSMPGLIAGMRKTG
jgi:phosphoglycolate phosphatase